jgi:hypothetical protein
MHVATMMFNISSYFILLEQKGFEGYLHISKTFINGLWGSQPALRYTRYRQSEAPVRVYLFI